MPINSNDIYAIGVPIIVLMILAEVSFSSWRNRHFYQRADFFGTLGLLAGNITIAALSKGAVLALSFYLYQFRLFDPGVVLESERVCGSHLTIGEECADDCRLITHV